MQKHILDVLYVTALSVFICSFFGEREPPPPPYKRKAPLMGESRITTRRFTKKTPFFPISATVSVLESSLLSIRALFDAFKRL